MRYLATGSEDKAAYAYDVRRAGAEVVHTLVIFCHWSRTMARSLRSPAARSATYTSRSPCRASRRLCESVSRYSSESEAKPGSASNRKYGRTQ